MEDEKFFDLEIITPEKIFWKGQASMLEMPTTEGQVGISKQHIPMTMILAPGVMTIHLESENKEVAVDAGFLEILPEKITVMAESAEWLELKINN